MKLNKAQLKALAEGATEAQIAALASASDAADENQETSEAKAARIAAEAEVARIAAEAETARIAAEAAAAAAAGTATPPADNTAVVAHLTGQLAEANTALIQAKVEAATFKAAADSVDGLVTTLRAVLGEKLVALGASAESAAGLTASNIVAEFARIDAVFKKQFRPGGVAAVASPEPKEANAPVDPMWAEALKHAVK